MKYLIFVISLFVIGSIQSCESKDPYRLPETPCECVEIQLEIMDSDQGIKVFGVCPVLLEGKTEREQKAITRKYENCHDYDELERKYKRYLRDHNIELI